MADVPRVLLICSIILLLVDMAVVIWYFYMQKDVVSGNEGARNVITLIVLLALASFAFSFGLVIYRDINSSRLAAYAFGGAALMTLLVCWSVAELEGQKRRAMETVETIVSILEVENASLDGHSMHVYNLTMLLYDYLPYRMKRKINRVNLSYASLFIDLGKLGIPARVLNKTGKLLSDEWAIMKRHPEISARIFESIPSFQAVHDWILYHHERMDGNGYYHKAGREIPLASRVITVADTYSSITMNRSFKASLSYSDAMLELKLAAGTQLDPELVEIFSQIPRKRIEACFEDVRQRMARFKEEGFREEPGGGNKGEKQ
ncbi:MAG: HD domain-containing protein [Lachnospiraceae bacterium]|nr:HD domain-containing protein [Lachnospiraceae bacterium]